MGLEPDDFNGGRDTMQMQSVEWIWDDTELIDNDLKSISDLDHADPGCQNCNGQGWVCENHINVPWDWGEAECCDGECGAGSPCPCNPLSKTKTILN